MDGSKTVTDTQVIKKKKKSYKILSFSAFKKKIRTIYLKAVKRVRS